MEEEKGEGGLDLGDKRFLRSGVFDRAATDLAPAITTDLQAPAITTDLQADAISLSLSLSEECRGLENDGGREFQRFLRVSGLNPKPRGSICKNIRMFRDDTVKYKY